MKERNLKEALKHRRTYYSIGDQSPVTDQEIEDIISFAVKNTPSAFNSQSARLVLLLGDHHKKLWQIVKDALKNKTSEAAYASAEKKIDRSFASGYGTVLFFEDKDIVESLQRAYPLYHEHFPAWSFQSGGMHQYAVWTMLEDAGFGASLQHYNPLIDVAVSAEWKIPENWELLAQMPFGIPLNPPDKKEFKPLDKRVKIFK